MSQNVVVIAPHPDDETIACGGTLLKHIHQGDKVHWIIMTTMTLDTGFSEDEIKSQQQIIDHVCKRYPVASCQRLSLPTTQMDCLPLSDIVRKLKLAINELNPEVLYLPFPGDVHSDHRASFDAAASLTKWFRFPSLKRILCYEALSETDYAIHPNQTKFQPNVYIDISEYWQQKIDIAECYSSEFGTFPFPRSIEAMTALAQLRGSQRGCDYAESFMLLKELS